MNALTLRTLSTFPPELQSQVRAHRFDDIDELVQQVALALLEARRDDTIRTIFNRGRSACRRFTQDLAHYCRALDAVAGLAAADADADGQRRGLKRRDITRDIAETFRVTPQRAGQIVDEQLRRAAQGDFFADDGSEVTE
ncbi:MAG: hypothetical protein ACYC0G_13120 [Thiobacillus sp.]